MTLRLLLAQLLLWSLDLPRSGCEDREYQIVNRPENLAQSDFIIMMPQYFSQNDLDVYFSGLDRTIAGDSIGFRSITATAIEITFRSLTALIIPSHQSESFICVQ